MNMIAEGYYGSESASRLKKKFRSDTPILDTVHSIMYKNTNSKKAFKRLESKLD